MAPIRCSGAVVREGRIGPAGTDPGASRGPGRKGSPIEKAPRLPCPEGGDPGREKACPAGMGAAGWSSDGLSVWCRQKPGVLSGPHSRGREKHFAGEGKKEGRAWLGRKRGGAERGFGKGGSGKPRCCAGAFRMCGSNPPAFVLRVGFLSGMGVTGTAGVSTETTGLPLIFFTRQRKVGRLTA